MKVSVDGVSLELTDKDLIGSGGQGQVFVKGQTAYKIYTDPQYMLPVDKIRELSAVQHPTVIKPLNVIHGAKQAPVGYTMAYVKGASPLCQLFTRPFRDANKIGQTSIQSLVDQMTEMVMAAHKAKVLLVDLNEMNFLAGGQDFDKLYAIDVDSWQTPNFPAQAIMPSVRDVHALKFSEGTDWFSFAIVTFQLYIGIHPYRGKHPSLKGFDERMKANASVFRKDVRMPACCYPLDVIPKGMRAWYEKVFEHGDRSCPGFMAIQSIVVPDFVLPAPTSNAAITVTRVSDLQSAVIAVYCSDDGPIVVSKSHVQIGQRAHTESRKPDFIWKKADKIVFGRLKNGDVTVATVDGIKQNEPLEADGVVHFGSRVALKMGGTLAEAHFMVAPSGLSPMFHVLCQVMPGAKCFHGCLIQEMLGAKVLVASPAPRVVYQPILKELQKFRVIDARLDGTVLMTVSEQNGDYYRHVFRFDDVFENYDVTATKTNGMPSINFVVLPKRIVVLIDEEDNVVLFPAAVGNKAVKNVDGGGAVQSSDVLYCSGNDVMIARNKTIYTLKVK